MAKGFEYKIAGILLVILLLVSTTGVFAYKRFSEIVERINQDARPDYQLLTIKSLNSSLENAENAVKSYSLTQDTTYMLNFHVSGQAAEYKLDELHQQTNLHTDVISFDHLENLVDQKLDILEQMLISQDNFRVSMALDKVEDEINDAVLSQRELKDVDNDAKLKLRNLFKRKKPEIDIERMTMSDISREVRQVKTEEEAIERAFKIKELSFIHQLDRITAEINEMITTFENLERKAIAEEAEYAENAIEEANFMIILFCVSAGILLFIMAFLIINYTRYNKRFRQAQQEAKEQAEALANAKERFLANMSHEIRTPMNAIIGFTDQLMESNLNEVQHEQLGLVHKSTEHLLYLINDILDYSKLKNDKLKLESIAFSPAEVMEEVTAFVHPLSSDKNLKLICNTEEDIPKVVIGDPFRLRQILLNLMSNAIKFTEQGSVALITTVASQENKEIELLVSVKDTGIGIEPEQLKRVFEEFEQSDSGTARNYGGTGLGLAITKMLTEAHGGSIEIESEPQKGTTIMVKLPYTIGDESDLPKKAATIDAHSVLAGKRILVVDDEPYNRKLLTTILSKYDIQYQEAKNGLEAVEAVAQEHFDVVLMDERMPEMNGIEAAQAIRNNEAHHSKRTPIIALTAAVSKEDMQKYAESGMDGVLAKPYKVDALVKTIAEAMNLDLQKNQPRDQQEEKPIADLEELKTMAGGDEAFFKDMIETFIQGTEEGIVELDEGLKNQDWKMIAETAHRMSSPCKHLSVYEMLHPLKEMELKCRKEIALDTIPGLIAQTKAASSAVIVYMKKALITFGE